MVILECIYVFLRARSDLIFSLCKHVFFFFFFAQSFVFFFSNFPNRFLLLLLRGDFVGVRIFTVFLLSFDRLPLYLLLLFVFALCLHFFVFAFVFAFVFYFVNGLFILPLTGLFCH